MLSKLLVVCVGYVAACSTARDAGEPPSSGHTLPTAEYPCTSETFAESNEEFFASIARSGAGYRLVTVMEVTTLDQPCFYSATFPELECSRCESVGYGLLLTVNLEDGSIANLSIPGDRIVGHSWQGRPTGIGTPPSWSGHGRIVAGDKLLVAVRGTTDLGYLVAFAAPMFSVVNETWEVQQGFLEATCLDGVSVSQLREDYPTVAELMDFFRVLEAEQQPTMPLDPNIFDPTRYMNECVGEARLPESDTSFAPCESSADCDAGQNCVGNFCI